jgi:hypothetical protein
MQVKILFELNTQRFDCEGKMANPHDQDRLPDHNALRRVVCAVLKTKWEYATGLWPADQTNGGLVTSLVDAL